jgi:micrococcal nuclease
LTKQQVGILGALGVAVVFVWGYLGMLVCCAIPPPSPETTERPIPSSPTREPTEPATATGATVPTATSTALPTPTNTPIPPTAPPTRTWTPTHTHTSALTATSTPTLSKTEARVVAITDGDTIQVEIGGQVYRLRYIGIDCPEPGQPGCWEASEANRQLVEGKTILLEKDVSDTDRYGRLLRYVYVGGLLVNAEMVRLGYASAKSYPPDVAYDDLFARLQQEAREEGRGLWAVPTAASGPSWNRIGNIYNCSDFSSCAEVMSYWNACPGDPSHLDGDYDGRPCEAICG